MLADFQQALADLTASPAFCRAVREDAAALDGRYALSDRERQRLLGIVRHPGMSAACTVYRMNRVAPLAMNLPATLRALGPASREAVEAYWLQHPRGHAHFFLESDRFCRWLQSWIGVGATVPKEVSVILDREASAVRAAIGQSEAGQVTG